MDWLFQKTLSNQVNFKGVGLHTGKSVQMTVCPAPVDSGITFIIGDVRIPAHAKYLADTKYCTSLTYQGEVVKTIEHFLSATTSLGLDNLDVYLTNSEVPLLDGSSADFLWGLSSVGIVQQDQKKLFASGTKRVEVQLGESVASIEPFNSPNVHVTLEYSEPVITQGGLSMQFDLFLEDYAVDIARARTYGFEKNLDFFKQHQLAQGATLENCLVMNDDAPLSPGGLRYNNEVVRHKILDVFGDLALLGAPFLGRYRSYQPGHTINLALVKKLLEENAVQFISLSESNLECPGLEVKAC